MPTITAVRQALADTLATLTTSTGLAVETHARLVGQVNPPALIVAPGEGTFLTYRTSNVSHDLNLMVTAFLQWGEDQSADELLDEFLAISGTASVYATVDADPTLGGVVSSAAVLDAQGYGIRKYGEIDYLSCEWPVEVYL